MKNFLGRAMGGCTRHKILTIIIAVLIVIAAAGGVFVFQMKKPDEKVFASGQKNTVELTKMDLTNSISATGTIESVKTKLVSAQVSDVEVKSVRVSEGDKVKKGQVILTFDKTDLQSTLSEAEENLSDVTEQTARELSSARRRLSEAESTYRLQKSRLAKSVAAAKKNNPSAYEQAVAEQEKTNKQNKSEIQSAKDSVATAESNSRRSIREAKKKVEDAEKALEECSVTAPISGTVTAVGVEPGDVYSGGNLFEICDCTDLQVSTTVGEYDISNVKKGQKAVILTDATGEKELEGKITYVSVSAGSSSLSVGSNNNNAGGSSMLSSGGTSASSGSDGGYTVIIKINDTDENLRIGMTAKCSIILKETEDVYAVPYDAIHKNAEGKQVIYVADSAGKREVEVEKGMESDYYVEVSGENLQEGMKVFIPTDSIEVDNNQKSSKDSENADIPNLGGMPRGDKSDMGGRDFSGGRPGM